MSEQYSYDCFVSHASEDKAAFVEPLVAALQARGLAVWYDAQQIKLGDDFRQRMDEGLRSSRFGVVVASPSFAKFWPEQELSALFTQESIFKEKRILPVFHNLTPEQVALQSPMLVSRAAAFSSEGVDAVAAKIIDAVGPGTAKPSHQASGLYGVPDLHSTRFVGRDVQLERLEQLLLGANSVRVSASIEGLAGIGKTELALQLVQRLAEKGHFPGGIYWFDAEDPDLSPAWASTIADALSIQDGPAPERALLALKAVAARQQPSLIVLDNVAVWEGNDHPTPLPEGPLVQYLVTTRERSLGGSRFRSLELGILPAPFDRQLLEKAAEKDLSAVPGLDDLLEYLGGHALALELAGAYLSEYAEETPESYLEALTCGEDLEADVTKLVRYERTVHQAFQTLWERLAPELRDTWRLAACFEPDPVSVELSDAVGVTKSHRRDLRRLHLIEASSTGNWKMHRLTRAFGEKAGSEVELAAARKSFVKGCLEFSRPINSTTGAMLYLPNRANLDVALAMAPDYLGDDLELATFCDRVGRGVWSAGELAQAEPYLREALSIVEKSRAGEVPEVALHLNHLARLLQLTNRLGEAEPMLWRALEICERSYGSDHPVVATALNNLAQLLKAANRLGEAEPMMRRALKIYEKSYGLNHPKFATGLNNLAQLLKATNREDEAEPMMRRALGIDEKSYGSDHPEVATDLNNLAQLLQATNRLDEAEPLMRRSLKILEASFEEGHPHLEAVKRWFKVNQQM